MAGAFMILAIALLISGRIMQRSSEYFRKNRKSGKAVVVGYDRTEQSNWYSLKVKIPALGDNCTYGCSGGKLDLSKYPVGTVVDVWYAPKKSLGLGMVEIHLMENPPGDSGKIGRVITILSIFMLIIAVAFVLVGLLSVFS